MSGDSMNFNYEFNYKAITNGSSQTGKTNEVKEAGELPSGNKFDYDKLNDLFLNEGLDALLEELHKLEEENIIQNLKTETNKVSCTYQDIEYVFEAPSVQNKPTVSPEPIDDTPPTEPEQSTVPQGNGINYNRYKITYSNSHSNTPGLLYSYEKDSRDRIAHAYESDKTINLKDLYEMITQGKIDEAIALLLKNDFSYETKYVDTPDGEVKEITIKDVHGDSDWGNITISYDQDYTKNIPYPEGVSTVPIIDKTEQERMNDLAQHYQEIMDSFPDWTPALIGYDEYTHRNYRPGDSQRPVFPDVFDYYYANYSDYKENIIASLSKNTFGWSIESNNEISLSLAQDLLERYTNKNRDIDEIDYMNYYDRDGNYYSGLSLFYNALLAACGATCNDSVETIQQKLLTVLTPLISGHEQTVSRTASGKYITDSYDVSYVDLLEFVTGKNSAGIDYLKQATESWFNL